MSTIIDTLISWLQELWQTLFGGGDSRDNVASSAQRLQKLAETIAALTRNAKRRNAARMDKSIREWESDLAYLKRRYDEGRFSFTWPVTDL